MHDYPLARSLDSHSPVHWQSTDATDYGRAEQRDHASACGAALCQRISIFRLSTITHSTMASSDCDYNMATDRLLEKEHSSMDSSTSDLGLEVPRTKRHWADPTRLRVSFFIHLTLIAIYTLAFSLTVDHISKKYQHGPDLIYCKINVKYCISFDFFWFRCNL